MKTTLPRLAEAIAWLLVVTACNAYETAQRAIARVEANRVALAETAPEPEEAAK